MEAFDAWRRSLAGGQTWAAGKGEYFLSGEELKDFRAKRAALMNWPVLRRELATFYEKVKLDVEKRKKLEGVLKAHLGKVYAAVRDQEHLNLALPANRAKAKAITRATEAELAKLLGSGNMTEFRKWKLAPGARSHRYFGESYRPPKRPVGTRPAPSVQPTGPQPAKPGGATKF